MKKMVICFFMILTAFFVHESFASMSMPKNDTTQQINHVPFLLPSEQQKIIDSLGSSTPHFTQTSPWIHNQGIHNQVQITGPQEKGFSTNTVSSSALGIYSSKWGFSKQITGPQDVRSFSNLTWGPVDAAQSTTTQNKPTSKKNDWDQMAAMQTATTPTTASPSTSSTTTTPTPAAGSFELTLPMEPKTTAIMQAQIQQADNTTEQNTNDSIQNTTAEPGKADATPSEASSNKNESNNSTHYFANTKAALTRILSIPGAIAGTIVAGLAKMKRSSKKESSTPNINKTTDPQTFLARVLNNRYTKPAVIGAALVAALETAKKTGHLATFTSFLQNSATADIVKFLIKTAHDNPSLSKGLASIIFLMAAGKITTSYVIPTISSTWDSAIKKIKGDVNEIAAPVHLIATSVNATTNTIASITTPVYDATARASSGISRAVGTFGSGVSLAINKTKNLFSRPQPVQQSTTNEQATASPHTENKPVQASQETLVTPPTPPSLLTKFKSLFSAL